MNEDRNQHQVIRKDARNCFVESLNDAFEIGRIHLAFATYDLSRPIGQRQTNNIHIYIAVDEFLELCRKLAGSKSDFLFVADSGPGETDQKGLIVPKFGSKPENHVAVSMTFETFSELLLTTRLHYSAWLGAWYANQYHPGNQRTAQAQENPQYQEKQGEAEYASDPMF